MKKCSKCKIEKPDVEFGFDPRYINRSQCRDCERVTMRRNKVKFSYGVSLEWIENKRKLQKGCCAICKEFHGDDLDVDHNHETGKVRELLCKRCNRQILGFSKESITLLENAILYLRKHKQ